MKHQIFSEPNQDFIWLEFSAFGLYLFVQLYRI